MQTVVTWFLLLTLFFPHLAHERADEGLGLLIDRSIDEAVVYLRQAYNAEMGLIPESPETCPRRYWLMTDNWLAAHALAAAGAVDIATQLEEKLAKENPPRHGIVEALAGEPIAIPPRGGPLFDQETCQRGGVYSERRDGSEMGDWEEYVDLRLYGAIHAVNQGDRGRALELYAMTIDDFRRDRLGYRDLAFSADNYATYKLALTLYVGNLLAQPTEQDILFALLGKQAESGGFNAHYDEQSRLIGDTNTETTAYALLALARLAGSAQN